MPNLEIITIGTELLLGEIIDTNSTYIARTLRDHGIDIFRITTIGDNPQRIASAIDEALQRADIVITTGGLGPTVDDPTRQAIADATHRELIFDPDLWEDILDRFNAYGRTPTENNRRQAFIPSSSIPIKNPVGTAPCFIVEIGKACVISLPGVPQEMEYILHHAVIPYLRDKFVLKTQIIKAVVLHAASMGESSIDEVIGDLEERSNPTVGLLAHPGQVDIRVTVKANSTQEALELIKPVVDEIKARLGNNIYGQDEQTLEVIISRLLGSMSLKLGLVEYGLQGALIKRIELGQPPKFDTWTLFEKPQSQDDFQKQINNQFQNNRCDILFGVALYVDQKAVAHFVYQDQFTKKGTTRMYGGPQAYAQQWALNTGLDYLRRHISASYGEGR